MRPWLEETTIHEELPGILKPRCLICRCTVVWDIPNSADNFRVLVLGCLTTASRRRSSLVTEGRPERARSSRLMSPCEKRLNQICAIRALTTSSPSTSHISRSAAAALKPFQIVLQKYTNRVFFDARSLVSREEMKIFKIQIFVFRPYFPIFYRNPCSNYVNVWRQRSNEHWIWTHQFTIVITNFLKSTQYLINILFVIFLPFTYPSTCACTFLYNTPPVF